MIYWLRGKVNRRLRYSISMPTGKLKTYTVYKTQYNLVQSTAMYAIDTAFTTQKQRVTAPTTPRRLTYKEEVTRE